MKPNRITVSRSARGTTIKATGHAAQRLFDALTKGPQKLPLQGFQACTVHFADKGQDFLEWDVDATGRVLASRGQDLAWRGVQLVEPPKAGQLVRYVRPSETQTTKPDVKSIAYPVVKVVQVIDTPAAPA